MTTTRLQVTLDPAEHHRATTKARSQGISLAEYIRRVVAADLDEAPRQAADLSELFGIGDSGGSDVSRQKDAYLGEALGAPARSTTTA